MDIRQIEVFLGGIEHGTVTRAAQKLYISPGAVSLQLQKLAAELQTQPFVRAGKNIVPTPAALRLAEPGGGRLAGTRRRCESHASCRGSGPLLRFRGSRRTVTCVRLSTGSSVDWKSIPASPWRRTIPKSSRRWSRPGSATPSFLSLRWRAA